MQLIGRWGGMALIWILLSSMPAKACNFDDVEGPSVALVFSGGGALAATQVGALKVIEDVGVPVHCVVGTSMGAFASGLYAAGYSAAELEEIFAQTPWGAVFRGDVTRDETSFIHKEREGQYLSNYVIGVGPDGLNLPEALGTMRGVKALLREKLRHLPGNMSFDDLRVPFRAVATNLSTGKAVPFKEGDLVEAILASMAVPAAFPARVIDGEVYVDGGMSAQLPIEIAQNLGADIIIALDTSVPPARFDGPVSFIASAQQLIQLSVWQNRERQVAQMNLDHDLLIQPDIKGLNAAAFERTAEGLGRGEAAAEALLDRLQKIAQIAAPARDKILSREPLTLVADGLIIDNDSVIDDDTIRARLDLDADLLDDPERLPRRLNDLAAFGGFGSVDLSTGEGLPVLTLRGRSLGRNLLQIGAQASNAFDGDSTYAFLARYSRRPFGPKGGEFAVNIEFGTDISISAELYQPFGGDGRFFVRPELFYRAERVLFDVGEVRLGEFREEFGGLRLRLGRELGTWGVVGLDGLLTVGRFDERITILPDFAPENYELGGVGGFAAADTLDRLDWPRRGGRLEVSAQRLWDFGEASSQTDKFNVNAIKALSWRDWGVLASARYEAVRNDDDDPVDVISLGGFRRLSAFAEETLPTNEYVLGSVELYRRLTNTRGITNFPVYLGVTAEVADLQLDILDIGTSNTLYAVSAYIGAQTPIGPIFFGGGYGEAGARALFFSLGRRF